MSEEDLVLRFRPRTFSAFAVLAGGAILLFALWTFGIMVLDGVRDWRVTVVVGLLIAVLLIFTYLVPWNIRFSQKKVAVRYFIGRTARFDLQDLSNWRWQSNTSGGSGLCLNFKAGKSLNIPPMFVDDRLPAILNRYSRIDQAQQR
jgi:hypothetical protein